MGYCMARNRPARARSHVGSPSRSSPSRVTCAAGDLVAGPAHEHVGQRALARAVRAHHRVHLAAAHLEVDRRGGSPCRPPTRLRPSITSTLPISVITTRGRRHRPGPGHRPGTGRVAGRDCGLPSTREKVLPCFQHSICARRGRPRLPTRRSWRGCNGRRWRRSRRRCAPRQIGLTVDLERVEPFPRATSSRRQSRSRPLGHDAASARVELGLPAAPATTAAARGTGVRSSTSSRNPRTISRSATSGGTPRLSR